VARLWSSGFELNSLTAGVELSHVNTGTSSISTTTKRSGDYAFRSNPSAATGYMTHQFLASAGTANFFLRFYLRITTAPGGLTIIARITNSGGANNMEIRLNSNRTLEMWYNDSVAGFAQGGSDSSALSLDTWYRIEMDFSSSRAVAYLDGTQFAIHGAFPGLSPSERFMLGAFTASTTCDLFFDDVAFNDTSGSFQTGLPGAGSILHMQPNAAGDNTQFTPLSGSNWENVDEVTPDNGTTYNYSSADSIDDFNLESFTNAGGPAVDSIKLVQVGLRSYQADSSFTSLYIRIKASSGGTVEESSALDPNATNTYETFKKVGGNTDYIYRLTLYDLPGASTSAWTTTNLDAAQIGYRLDQVFGGQARGTTSWLLVEYIPSAVTSFPHKIYKYMQAVKRASTY